MALGHEKRRSPRPTRRNGSGEAFQITKGKDRVAGFALITPTEVPDNPAALRPIVTTTSTAGYTSLARSLRRADRRRGRPR